MAKKCRVGDKVLFKNADGEKEVGEILKISINGSYFYDIETDEEILNGIAEKSIIKVIDETKLNKKDYVFILTLCLAAILLIGLIIGGSVLIVKALI